MKYKGYEVWSKFVKDGSYINWKITGNGSYIIADKNGISYFIKRSTSIRYPDKALDKEVYLEDIKKCKFQEDKQKEIRKLLNKVKFENDHIAVELENLWDDNYFTTYTRFIPDVVDESDFSMLDFKTFLKLCRDSATLIDIIHTAGVTHGDLKEKNMIIQNDSGKYIPYLIDFDSSYPTRYGKEKSSKGIYLIGEQVTFSDGYESPEIVYYNYQSEFNNNPGAIPITEKTDIFSLGIIFHNYWANSFPTVDDKNTSAGIGICCNAPIVLDPKFDIEIGPNYKCKFSSLLYWMLAKEAKDRPSAKQVIDVLDDKLDVEDFYETPNSENLFDNIPHKMHLNIIDILSKDELKSKGIKSFSKTCEKGQFLYIVKYKNGVIEKLTQIELCEKGLATLKVKNSGLWPVDEKSYKLKSNDELLKLGVIYIEMGASPKGYIVHKSTGIKFSVDINFLKTNGYVTPLIVEDNSSVDFGDDNKPFPEDGTCYNITKLKEKKYIKVKKILYDSNRYY
ncbi:MAG: hypothetical protein K5765_04740, partial [Clostridia bacterium]|nr:hypothetical protein [Clostridia bacterium]